MCDKTQPANSQQLKPILRDFSTVEIVRYYRNISTECVYKSGVSGRTNIVYFHIVLSSKFCTDNVAFT
jgi:hypothetical protein